MNGMHTTCNHTYALVRWCAEDNVHVRPNRCQYPRIELVRDLSLAETTFMLLSNGAIPYPIDFFTSDRFCHCHAFQSLSPHIPCSADIQFDKNTYIPSRNLSSHLQSTIPVVQPTRPRQKSQQMSFDVTSSTFRCDDRHLHKRAPIVGIKRWILISQSSINNLTHKKYKQRHYAQTVEYTN